MKGHFDRRDSSLSEWDTEGPLAQPSLLLKQNSPYISRDIFPRNLSLSQLFSMRLHERFKTTSRSWKAIIRNADFCRPHHHGLPRKEMSRLQIATGFAVSMALPLSSIRGTANGSVCRRQVQPSTASLYSAPATPSLSPDVLESKETRTDYPRTRNKRRTKKEKRDERDTNTNR